MRGKQRAILSLICDWTTLDRSSPDLGPKDRVGSRGRGTYDQGTGGEGISVREG